MRSVSLAAEYSLTRCISLILVVLCYILW